MAGREGMRLGTSTTRTFRYGLIAIVVAAFTVAFGVGNMPSASAQSDDASKDAATSSAAPNGADDADQKAQTYGDQQAHDAADAAQQVLESATEARDQLESDGASQDQIDAANQAIAQARANKDAADAAAQSSDDATSQSGTNSN
jgi:cell division septation protein DedD